MLGAIPTISSMTLSNLLRSTGYSKQAGLGIPMGGILNIALDPLFMFVLLPEGMEVLGVGIATMLSNVIVCAYFLLTLYRLGSSSSLSLSPSAGLPAKDEIRSIFAVGIPAAIGTLLFDLAYIVIDKLASSYGDVPLAAIGIVLKAERLPLNIGIGICQGMMPIAAYNYASGNFGRMHGVVKFSRTVGLMVAGVCLVLYEVFAPEVIQLFIDDAETIRLGINFLRARSFAAPFMFMCFHLVNFFQAVGYGTKALMLAVGRWAVFNIPLLLVFNYVFGMYGIVWTQAAADGLMTVCSLMVYNNFTNTTK